MKDPSTGVVIGCFGGFWGDSMDFAVGQFLRSKESDSIDYLVSDYLAEVTMCILAKKKARPSKGMQEGGFCEDFATRIWKPFGKMLLEKQIKVVVNAGGLNPIGLQKVLEEMSSKMVDLPTKPIIAAVVGDDLKSASDKTDHFAKFVVDGSDVANDDGITAADLANPNLSSMNAYIGARGITAALASGAHVVVTGRCVDSALVLGPLCHEHKWSYDKDFDLLAAGSIAGHVIECGAQCTGGNFTDWELGLKRGISTSKLLANIGFPLVKVQADGNFLVTKPKGTGGIVSRLSVAEQLVYEIGDPKAYLVADCTCDVRHLTIEEVAKDEVRVQHVRGGPPTGLLKTTATFSEGYIGIFSFVVSGNAANSKGKAIVGSLLSRVGKILASTGAPPFDDVRVEYLGTGGSYYPEHLQRHDALEIVVRLSARHRSAKALLFLASHIPSASTGMCPSLWSIAPGKPPIAEAVRLKTGLVKVNHVPVSVRIGEATQSLPMPPDSHPASAPLPAPDSQVTAGLPTEPTTRAKLLTIACCRSGDKGNAANVGVVARHSKYFPFLMQHLTPALLRSHLSAWCTDATTIHRFQLPGLSALNFVLSSVLGGGGLMSLMGDKQGKSIGSVLLCLELEIPTSWVKEYEEGVGAAKAVAHAKL